MYQDLGRDHFDRRSTDRQKKRLIKRLTDLGYAVTIKPLAARACLRHRQQEEFVAWPEQLSFFLDLQPCRPLPGLLLLGFKQVGHPSRLQI
jgi:hypothetical protein